VCINNVDAAGSHGSGSNFMIASILWRREKMQDASTSAGCAEMPKFRTIGYLVHFGETGDSPDTLIFYFQHNKPTQYNDFPQRVQE